MLSAGTAIYGGIQQSNAERQNAAIATQNANIATEQVNQINQQASDAQLQQYRKVAALRGQQTAGFAASGLDVSFGTPADVIAGTQVMGEEDAQRIRQSYTDKANSYIISAANYTQEAAQDKSAASSALIGGFLGAAGTVFKGASQVAGYKAGSGGVGGSS